MKSKILFVLTVLIVIALGYLLGGCAMTVQHDYIGADGNDYRMVNSTIVMPFSKSSTHTTVAEKIDELNYQLTDNGEITYQDGWIPEVGSTLGGAALISGGLSDSGNVINNSSSSLSNSESMGGSVDMDFMYKPKHRSKW